MTERQLDLADLADKLLADLPDALIVADADNIIRYWNAGAVRIFGFDEAEALGQSLDIITPENLRARHLDGFRRTMATGQTKYGAGDLLSVPAIRKDGARISVQFSIMPSADDTGTLTGVAAIMRDVTTAFDERKKLRAELADLCQAR